MHEGGRILQEILLKSGNSEIRNSDAGEEDERGRPCGKWPPNYENKVFRFKGFQRFEARKNSREGSDLISLSI